MVHKKQDSPAWKNPRDLVKRHVVKRRSSRCLTPALTASSSAGSLLLADGPSTSQSGEGLSPETTALQRTNPFKRHKPVSALDVVTSNARESIDLDDQNAVCPFDGPSPLIRALRQNDLHMHRSASEQSLQDLSSLYDVDFSMFGENSRANNPTPSQTDDDFDEFPALHSDLRLGAKLRVIRSHPFSWMNHVSTTGELAVPISAAEKQAAMSYFSALPTAKLDDDWRLDDLSADIRSPALLEAAGLYYECPSLDWLPFYPREPTAAISSAPQSKHVVEAISRQWNASFDDLFQRWLSHDGLASFYVCCATFQVVFARKRAHFDEEAAEDEIPAAVVSPAPFTLRQLLKSNGVQFSVQKADGAAQKRRSSGRGGDVAEITQSQPPPLSMLRCGSSAVFGNPGDQVGQAADEENKENASLDATMKSPEKNDDEDEMDEMSLLADMGVSPRRSLKFARHASIGPTATETTSNVAIDDLTGRKAALLVTDPESLKALHAFLGGQAGRAVVRTSTGPLAGMPPTLLSCSPFPGGRLRQLQRTYRAVKDPRTKELRFILELHGGAVLPHSTRILAKLLERDCAKDESPASLSVSQVGGVSRSRAWPALNAALDGERHKDVPIEVTWHPGQRVYKARKIATNQQQQQQQQQQQ